MRQTFDTYRVLMLIGVLAGCAAPQRPGNDVMGEINDVLLKSATERRAPAATLTDASLMPPLAPQLVKDSPATEPHFDLSVVNAPATQVFMALVSGTRYSMLLPPDVSGSLTINLKDVTLIEALDTIRELYGYEYRVQGKRIFIEPNTMKSRVFQINYLSSRRRGSSDLRVSSSSLSTEGRPTSTIAGSAAAPATPSGSGTTAAASSDDTTRVSMSTDSDFWGDLNRAMTSIVGNADGRSIVINPSSGTVVVRALPTELRNVDKYLKATQLIAERQVMLEAKIIDVTLADGFQAGINWSTFNGSNNRTSVGVVAPGTILGAQSGTPIVSTPSRWAAANERDSIFPGAGAFLPGAAGVIAASALGRGFLGLAFQSTNFAALLNFLETQGSVSVLSSPRIATLNNQKAVLKVGTDELFVTNVSSTTTTTTTGTTSAPDLTLQPYFSGISLDVTPQIDEDGNIILHVHPAISTVTEKEKVINLGDLGTFVLPLASSNINETDSIVRVQNGSIVAIGGLMRHEKNTGPAQLPGASGFFANVLGQRSAGTSKRELVILIKPTVINNDGDWMQDIKEVQGRMRAYSSERTTQ